MKKHIKILLLIIVYLYSCIKPYGFKDGYHSYFIFKNTSNIDIAVNYNAGRYDSNDYGTVNKSSIEANKGSMVVYANSTNDMLLALRKHQSWEHLVFRKYDTLKLFIFDYAKLLSMEPKDVPFDSVFLQRYDLTLRELDLLGWELSYPPDERMKNIHMYPSYGGE